MFFLRLAIRISEINLRQTLIMIKYVLKLFIQVHIQVKYIYITLLTVYFRRITKSKLEYNYYL